MSREEDVEWKQRSARRPRQRSLAATKKEISVLQEYRQRVSGGGKSSTTVDFSKSREEVEAEAARALVPLDERKGYALRAPPEERKNAQFVTRDGEEEDEHDDAEEVFVPKHRQNEKKRSAAPKMAALPEYLKTRKETAASRWEIVRRRVYLINARVRAHWQGVLAGSQSRQDRCEILQAVDREALAAWSTLSHKQRARFAPDELDEEVLFDTYSQLDHPLADAECERLAHPVLAALQADSDSDAELEKEEASDSDSAYDSDDSRTYKKRRSRKRKADDLEDEPAPPRISILAFEKKAPSVFRPQPENTKQARPSPVAKRRRLLPPLPITSPAATTLVAAEPTFGEYLLFVAAQRDKILREALAKAGPRPPPPAVKFG